MARAIVALLVFCFATAARAPAQSLSAQGDRFAIDGVPKFLTFISYFGAMNAANVTADLQYIRSKGFDGVRIWPNLSNGPYQLMNSDGSLSSDGLKRLLFVLDRARDERLVVDVTFTAEHVAGLDASHYRDAIAAATAELRRYDGLLFDIQNERDVYGPFNRSLAAADVAGIRAAVKSIDPTRLVTASNSPQTTSAATAALASQTGLDITAYHDARIDAWYRFDELQSLVAALRANGRPAYLQEPSRYPYASTNRASFFREAIANAKLAGAAAWCFHTDLGFDLRDALFQDRLESRSEPEAAFVSSLIPRVTLGTSNVLNYLTAEGGGGSDVRADRMVPGPWETFRIDVLAGGPLVRGDLAAFATSDGTHYLEAVGGGGAALRATGTSIGPWETFIVEKADGAIIGSGDAIRLRTSGAPWYVVAEGGGGGSVNVNRPVPGPWETFTISVVR